MGGGVAVLLAAGALGALLIRVAADRTVPPAAATPTPTTTAPPPAAPPAAGGCPAPTATAADAMTLQTALDTAGPGSSIRLADGVYPGRFVVDVSGTAAAPIHVCGGPGAILDGAGPDAGSVLHLDGASDVRLVGFTVRNGRKGILVDRGRRVTLAGLTVERIGDEAIHLRAFSSDNLVERNLIRGTGLRRPQFGEGVYVGSAAANWCAVSSCAPDASDRNVVRGNRILGTTAEAVDIKEGTTGGQLVGNVFDGSRLVGAYADSWVDVKGNGWTIRGNRGRASRGDGFQTHAVVPGWGRGNVFAGNAAAVSGPGWGYRFSPALDNRLSCDNTATGAARGLANVPCR
ncbi:hypothetical protein GCM10010123_09750 [Pilimelia anulata]|uniref:Right handed beta helix domain-containing protein n=1 Tax=Pilimelia anulata TaxID=53371 RepID=A0A8J3B2V2_9ACTN|nr:right-handed parallel beta-helix repeat-containing protein [Pilimelia anulata]GGJ82029.1 hypothetical protein GCM10010123_09750 [Pilimelia anulata]